MIKIVTKEK